MQSQSSCWIAGHGGIDPGTKSGVGHHRKGGGADVFARVLKAKLEAAGRYEVHLTREDDTFLALRERVAFAQKKGAGLFLSIHADYFPQEIDKTTGATVYTLSEQSLGRRGPGACRQGEFFRRARGRRAAERFRRGAGEYPDRPGAARNEEPLRRVRAFDRRRIASRGTLHTHTLGLAGFFVLKAPDVPSVLLDSDFLSNPDDEKLLTSEAWRERTAEAVANPSTPISPSAWTESLIPTQKGKRTSIH